MTQNNIVITVTTSSRPGVLSGIVRDIGHYGLIYNGQSIDKKGSFTILKIKCSGELHCTKERLAATIEELPEVHRVNDISVSGSIKPVKASQSHLSSHEPLSTAVLLAAEKRLSNIIGPVASYLVETASKNCRNTGELYLQLANELSTQQERKDFLSVIRDLKTASQRQAGKNNSQPSSPVVKNNTSLSPEIIFAAEKHLSDILGPVAGFLVEKASAKCKTASELYQQLAKELDNEEERKYFLSRIG